MTRIRWPGPEGWAVPRGGLTTKIHLVADGADGDPHGGIATIPVAMTAIIGHQPARIGPQDHCVARL